MNKLSTDQRDDLDERQFAFPKERKEPLETRPMFATRLPASIRSKT
jgi:hypothetical protein